MPLTLILHEAERTGAPRVGGVIANALQKQEHVRIIVLKNGPLVPWLQSTVGEDAVTICGDEEFSNHRPFAERFEYAISLLESEPGDIVYVNSVAASIFVIAAREIGKAVILHVHEKAAELRHLLSHGMTKLEVFSMADAVVLAAEGMRQDLVDVCGILPQRLHDFGIAIDFDAVRNLSKEMPATATNAAGKAIKWGKRFVVGMCGHASRRKGSDIFLEVAKQVPEHDFVWIGGWDKKEAIENTAFDAFKELELPNLYVTGAVDNPYKYLSKLGMFFLSSREDPNPLVLAESMVLQVPVLCFSGTTAVTDFMGRSAIVCYGPPNAQDATRVLKTIAPKEVMSESFRSLVDGVVKRFDINVKVEGLLSLVDDVRKQHSGTEPVEALAV